MDVCTTVAQLRRVLAGAARPVGFVPTMGALHEGHRALVRAAVAASATTVASVFVNPLQFGPGEDFDAYPRDLEGDLAALERDGVDVVLAPAAADLTPPERRTEVRVRGITETLEGAVRPGHFDGVATVVAKLLGAVGPDRAYFGEKDYQQLLVIRALVADLHLPVEVVACPTVREPDGLALSSRNAYLDAEDRARARVVPAALAAAAEGWDGDAEAARARMRAVLDVDGVAVDYAEVVDPVTLERREGRAPEPARALVAVRLAGTRLIDNAALPVPEAVPPRQ